MSKRYSHRFETLDQFVDYVTGHDDGADWCHQELGSQLCRARVALRQLADAGSPAAVAYFEADLKEET